MSTKPELQPETAAPSITFTAEERDFVMQTFNRPLVNPLLADALKSVEMIQSVVKKIIDLSDKQ